MATKGKAATTKKSAEKTKEPNDDEVEVMEVIDTTSPCPSLEEINGEESSSTDHKKSQGDKKQEDKKDGKKQKTANAKDKSWSFNADFLQLHAGAQSLLPKATSSKPKNDNAKDDKQKPADEIEGEENADDKKQENASKTKKKSGPAQIGEEKTVTVSELDPIAVDDADDRTRSFPVNMDFLQLHAGAQSLLPKATNSKPKYTLPITDFEEIKKSALSSEALKKEKERQGEEYYCDCCDATVNSFLTWQSHLQGKRHKKKLAAATGKREMAARANRDFSDSQLDLHEGVPQFRVPKKDATTSLKEKLELLSSPCIGLDFVTEIRRLDPDADTIYLCTLCNSVCQYITIIPHVIGYKHRLNYMKANDPINYAEVKRIQGKKSELTEALEQHAKSLESRFGRGRVKVEMEIEEPPSYMNDPFYPGMDYGLRRLPSPPPSLLRSRPNLPSYPPVTDKDIRNLTQYLDLSSKINVLKELGSLNNTELASNVDSSIVEYCLGNLKKTLIQYYKTGDVDPLVKEQLSGICYSSDSPDSRNAPMSSSARDTASSPHEVYSKGPRRPDPENYDFTADPVMSSMSHEADKFAGMRSPGKANQPFQQRSGLAMSQQFQSKMPSQPFQPRVAPYFASRFREPSSSSFGQKYGNSAAALLSTPSYPQSSRPNTWMPMRDQPVSYPLGNPYRGSYL